MFEPFQLPILPLEAILVMIEASVIFFLVVCAIKTVEDMLKIITGYYSKAPG